MIVVKVILIAIVCSIIAVIVKQLRPEFLPFIQIASILVILTVSIGSVRTVTDKISEIVQSADGFVTESAFLLFKVLIIAFVTKLAGEICKDNGNASVAMCVELAGKIIIIIMCFPLVETILELSLRFVE